MEIEEFSGHRDRLRERLRRDGMEEMKPKELLEFLLCYILPRQDVSGLAEALLERFGSLRAVLRAEMPSLARVPGSGKRVAEWLALVGECLYACNRAESEPGVELSCFDNTIRYVSRIRDHYATPSTVMVCMDQNGRPIYERELCPSCSWGEPAEVFDLMNDVLTMKANHLLLVQLVGSGPHEAGDYEVEHIGELARALHYLRCELMDLIIWGEHGITSLFQEGKIPDRTVPLTAGSLREAYVKSIPSDLRTLKILDHSEGTIFEDEGEES